MDSPLELLIQAIKENDLKYVEYCLIKGANPNKIAVCGKTALGVAAQHGNLVTFRTLVENQKRSLQTKRQPTSSEKQNSLNVNKISKNVGYFVVRRDLDENDFGEGPTPDGMEDLEWDMEIRDESSLSSTPPEAQIYKWYAEILNRTAIVLESPENDIARYDRYGFNALHYAVMEGHCNIAKYLLDNLPDFSVNQTDADMFSPLQIAANNGNLEMVKLLIEMGADVNYINRQRYTSLHFAAHKGYIEIINVLLEKGADINAYDSQDFSPLALSILHGHSTAAKLLIHKGTFKP